MFICWVCICTIPEHVLRVVSFQISAINPTACTDSEATKKLLQFVTKLLRAARDRTIAVKPKKIFTFMDCLRTNARNNVFADDALFFPIIIADSNSSPIKITPPPPRRNVVPLLLQAVEDGGWGTKMVDQEQVDGNNCVKLLWLPCFQYIVLSTLILYVRFSF